jgi:hypothetical protein
MGSKRQTCACIACWDTCKALIAANITVIAGSDMANVSRNLGTKMGAREKKMEFCGMEKPEEQSSV